MSLCSVTHLLFLPIVLLKKWKNSPIIYCPSRGKRERNTTHSPNHSSVKNIWIWKYEIIWLETTFKLPLNADKFIFANSKQKSHSLSFTKHIYAIYVNLQQRNTFSTIWFVYCSIEFNWNSFSLSNICPINAMYSH